MKSESALFDFNKNLITLSSTTLVLSFSVIQLTDSSIDKSKIGLSWFLLALSLVIGVVLYFIRFLTTFFDSVIKKKSDEKLYTKDDLLKNNEVIAYYFLIAFTFIFAFIQLLIFVVGISILMRVAFESL